MPYKRNRSRFWYCRRRNLPGYGDTGRLSSGTTDKRTAERMEMLLEEIANYSLVEPRWTRLLDSICKEKTITLAQVMQAKAQRRLPDLLRNMHDPLLTDAVAAYRNQGNPDRQEGYGLDKILAYAKAKAGSDARFSWLLKAQTIQEMLVHYESTGIKRNTVHRQVKRATSKLIRHRLGNAQRERIFAEVDFAPEDDTREVLLTPGEIDRLLEACKAEHHELYVIVLTALLTSADRGLLVAGRHPDGRARGLRCRDVQIFQEAGGSYSGEVFLPDTKTKDRQRTVPFGDRLARELLLLVKDKGADETVFSLRYSDIDYPWKEARKAAALKHLRFKDLRAQTAIYAERAGIPGTVAQRVLGHSDIAMTRRYQQHQAAMTNEQQAALEAEMFRKTGS